MKLTVLALSSALFATSVAAQDYSVPVDKSFNDGAFSWEGEISGVSFEYVYGIVAIDGKVAACGAGKILDATLAPATRDFMRKSHVEYNGKVVLKNLGFFTKVKKNGDLRTAEATCRLTTVPANVTGGEFLFVIAGGRARI